MNQEIEELISYAVKEGYLDDAEMTDREKESYYNRCMAYEPDEPDEEFVV